MIKKNTRHSINNLKDFLEAGIYNEEENSPLELRNIGPLRVRAYRILRPNTAFCTVNVKRLKYLRLLLCGGCSERKGTNH